MSKLFKPGDKIIKTCGDCCSAHDGEIYTVVTDNKHGTLGVGSDPRDLCHCKNEWQLLPEEIKSTNKKTNMSLTEKFALAFLKEPQKSFRKAGITNGDNLLTDEGMKIFLTWLLTKNENEFKTEVVDPLLAELKDDK